MRFPNLLTPQLKKMRCWPDKILHPQVLSGTLSSTVNVIPFSLGYDPFFRIESYAVARLQSDLV